MCGHPRLTVSAPTPLANSNRPLRRSSDGSSPIGNRPYGPKANQGLHLRPKPRNLSRRVPRKLRASSRRRQNRGHGALWPARTSVRARKSRPVTFRNARSWAIHVEFLSFPVFVHCLRTLFFDCRRTWSGWLPALHVLGRHWWRKRHAPADAMGGTTLSRTRRNVVPGDPV